MRRNFEWQLQQTPFISDVMVLPLGCRDLVSGIQWLLTLGVVLWDFQKLQMKFTIKGKKFMLLGTTPTSYKLFNNKTFNQAVQ